MFLLPCLIPRRSSTRLGLVCEGFTCDFLCFSFVLFSQMECVSWNVNGLSSLRTKSFFLTLFLSAALICFQETFETDPLTQGFSHVSYMKHALPATSTGGRPSGGLATFFSLGCFGNADLSQLPTGLNWLLASRVHFPSSGQGFLVVNVYVPR